ncbi:exonuclease V [Lipomyces orientalis]|uniref:Exonuclease V n=1 Tax=Lipomyces orientalis TaxID=1233043 RepID=A0ACC3TUC2_9ASCO
MSDEDAVIDLRQEYSVPLDSPSSSSDYGSLRSWDEAIYSAAIASDVVRSQAVAITGTARAQDDANVDEWHVDRMYVAKEAIARIVRELQINDREEAVLYTNFDDEEYRGRPVYDLSTSGVSVPVASPTLRSSNPNAVIPPVPPSAGAADVKPRRKRGRPRKVRTEGPAIPATVPAELPGKPAITRMEETVGPSDNVVESQATEANYCTLSDASSGEPVQSHQQDAIFREDFQKWPKLRKKNIEFEVEVPTEGIEQPPSRPRPFKTKRMRFPYLESEGIPSAPISSDQRHNMLPLHFSEATDFRGSMLETYKSHEKLYVTDVVGPSWCELQYFYKYYFNDFKPTAIMSKGTDIHKELEKEYMLEIPIATEQMTREDKQAVKLLNMLLMLQSLTQGARRHEENVIIREFPVFGFFENVLVSGIIDEVSFMYDRPIQEGTEFIDVDFPEISNQRRDTPLATQQQTLSLEANAGTVPFPTLESFSTSQPSARDQSSIMSYFRPLSQASVAEIIHDQSKEPLDVSHSVSNHENGEMCTYASQVKRRKLRIADSKTRYIRQLPHDSQQRSTYYQLLIYHRLLTDLTNGIFDFGRMMTVLKLDADAELSDIFKSEIQQNKYVTATLSAEILEDIQHRSDEYRALLLSLRTLREVWDALRLKFSEFAGDMSENMSVVYYWQNDGQVFAGIDYTYKEEDLQEFVSSSLSYWRGERDPKGVDVEDAYKCRSCPYADQCLWRLEKIRESTERNRARFQQRYGRKAGSRPPGQLVVERDVDSM